MNVRHHVPDAPMGPGKYITMRRDASGLDHVDVALALASSRWTPEEAGSLLLRLEGDEIAEGRTPDHVALIEAVEQVIRFDASVYWALVAARTDPRVVVPPICRDCACTFFDPCADKSGAACGWANAGSGEDPLCTFCAARADEPGPAPVGGTASKEPAHAA